jgi:UDP-N-acetylglucosamine 4,6-dehydratase
MEDTTFWDGKRVLVTGGTGTFGNAIVARLLAKPGVERVIVFSRDEYKQNEMSRRFTDPRLSFFLGDIRDKNRLFRAFNQVDIVVHAAALKQVPALEYNPSEAILTNVVGSQNVIEAALERNVERVMVISSDKAVHPINLYGATKLCAERVAVAANSYRGKEGKTRISAMRYGNVIGSRGSLVELIEKQKDSGVIPLTDERMTRFWIHVQDVIGVVLEAIERMEGGEIFVPKMKSTKVVDLIKTIAPDVRLEVIGMRPGEKLHEILITEYESTRTKNLERMYAVLPEFASWEQGDQFSSYPDFEKGLVFSSDSSHCMIVDKTEIANLIKPK